jgi:hypothetical protein
MFDDDHAAAKAGLALVGVLSEQLLFEDQANERPASRSVPLGRATRPEVILREQMVTIRVLRRVNQSAWSTIRGKTKDECI